MQLALAAAERAALAGEVPVGAVLSSGDQLVATAHNLTLTNADPTAHAEIELLRSAARAQGAARLPDTTLYVTLEPCLMCLGAMVHARISRLVYAASDPKVGAVALFQSVPVGFQGLNHRLEIEQGPLREESAALLRAFFRERRGD